LPNARLPLLLVLLLATAVVMIALFYLRPAGELLGGTVHPNEYEKALKGPKPKPVIIRPITPAAPPAVSAPGTPASTPAQPATPATTTPAAGH
jgi:hypothetical protein